jgi:lauroyl/myristoyl acyltransferase
MLRIGLEIADRIAAALPSRVAYALADLAGEAWHRLAPSRRRLVAANLARVCAATGRPTRGRAFSRLVRTAFRNHARYYMELLRTPHYRLEEIDTIVDIPQWESFIAALQPGPGVLMTSHLGNFEPFGVFLGAHGVRTLAPIEEIKPPALFEFLSAHRGGGNVELVPLSRAGRALRKRLQEGGLVGFIADRVIGEAAAQPVRMFGHETSIPLGPSTLVVMHRAGLVVGRCLRIGPDRFRIDGDIVKVPDTGDRRADIASLAERIAAIFERHIGENPEQWWGAFQPYWPDIPS